MLSVAYNCCAVRYVTAGGMACDGAAVFKGLLFVSSQSQLFIISAVFNNCVIIITVEVKLISEMP